MAFSRYFTFLIKIAVAMAVSSSSPTVKSSCTSCSADNLRESLTQLSYQSVSSVVTGGGGGVVNVPPSCEPSVTVRPTSIASTRRTTSVMKSYRPHGSLARIIYDKQKADERLLNYDKTQWYRVDESQIRDDLKKLWVPLGVGDNNDEPDEVAINFLDKSTERSDSLPLQAWHSFARSALSWFLSRTSINGLLGRGSMHVFSSEQFEKLIRASGYTGEWNSMIDLGAGDGATTSHIAHLFKNVYATEISAPMRWALARRGFTVLDVDDWHDRRDNENVESSRRYDVILCLNLLDRCDKPNTLLRRLKSSLTPGGRLVVALVLPFSPYVEVGERNDHKPSEYLPVKGNGLEGQIASLVDRVFSPLGLRALAWSKLPYLCEGDLGQAFYFLDDVIFVLEATEEVAYSSTDNETARDEIEGLGNETLDGS